MRLWSLPGENRKKNRPFRKKKYNNYGKKEFPER